MPATDTHADPDTHPDLATLLDALRRERGYPTWEAVAAATAGCDPSRPTERILSRQNVWSAAVAEQRGFLDRKTYEALAYALHVHVSALYIASAVSLGMAPPPTAGGFASLLPAGAERLPLDDQVAVRRVVQQMVDARGV